MPSSTFPDPEPERDATGNEFAWKEPGSDELMSFAVLVRVRAEGALIDARRERRILRREE